MQILPAKIPTGASCKALSLRNKASSVEPSTAKIREFARQHLGQFAGRRDFRQMSMATAATMTTSPKMRLR